MTRFLFDCSNSPGFSKLSTRAGNALFHHFGRCPSPEDVSRLTAKQMLKWHNFSKHSLNEVESWLSDNGLKLSDAG